MKILPPAGNAAIAQYQATVEHGSPSQTCNTKTDVDPLGCQIDSLLPARRYIIQVKGCLPASAGCGSFVEKAMWTKPNRMFGPKIPDITERKLTHIH